ncbi:MAG: phosphoribosyltransferase [Candidatus Terraquivivens tikiterensis]|uniref:Phosphoribosyltransferase n=1 Tax=Candidatus Terraquivivens tikiterensis TaxID=1980982 RepID=A0A2R7Y638_9ARCH|nr:MAG: phosphoribosyltransferase [Candidatus Terraquivivens tikiterensis]
MLKRVVPYKGESAYRVKVGELTRELPIVQVDKGLWIASDADLVLGDVEFISHAAELVSRKIRHFNPEVIVAPEAKALPLAFQVAKNLGHNRVVFARKSIKAYMSDYLLADAKSITTSEKQVLVLTGRDAEYLRGKRVCLLDDVVSTGGTLKALESITSRAGGKVVCKASIWIEGPWYDGELVFLEELPVFLSEEKLKDLERVLG